MSIGKIVQVIGAVVDVEFAKDSIPQVYDALKVDEAGLTLEVQQQLGDGIVRTIAMGTSDGAKICLSNLEDQLLDRYQAQQLVLIKQQ